MLLKFLDLPCLEFFGLERVEVKFSQICIFILSCVMPCILLLSILIRLQMCVRMGTGGIYYPSIKAMAVYLEAAKHCLSKHYLHKKALSLGLEGPQED